MIKNRITVTDKIRLVFSSTEELQTFILDNKEWKMKEITTELIEYQGLFGNTNLREKYVAVFEVSENQID